MRMVILLSLLPASGFLNKCRIRDTRQPRLKHHGRGGAYLPVNTADIYLSYIPGVLGRESNPKPEIPGSTRYKGR